MEETWETFWKSGKVNDYLSYRTYGVGGTETMEEPMGNLVRRSDQSGRNHFPEQFQEQEERQGVCRSRLC